MKNLQILFLLIATMLCSNLCDGLFFPLLKGLEDKLNYNSYTPTYGYRNFQGYNNGFYGDYHSPSSHYQRRRRSGIKRTGRTYSDIARVLNANPYAFVGARPYPAQPFYPQG